MLILTESKTEMLLKIGEIPGKVHTGTSTVDGTDKIGVLNASILKTEVEDAKIDEVLIGRTGSKSIKELTFSSVDEATCISIVGTWSWEVLGED